jgi:hypothetical protein
MQLDLISMQSLTAGQQGQVSSSRVKLMTDQNDACESITSLFCCFSSCENIEEGKRCQEKRALVVGPVRGERPVYGRGGLHIGPVGGSNPAHKLLFVHVPGVPVGVRQAYIRVHNELGVAQTQVVIAQERAL